MECRSFSLVWGHVDDLHHDAIDSLDDDDNDGSFGTERDVSRCATCEVDLNLDLLSSCPQRLSTTMDSNYCYSMTEEKNTKYQ